MIVDESQRSETRKRSKWGSVGVETYKVTKPRWKGSKGCVSEHTTYERIPRLLDNDDDVRCFAQVAKWIRPRLVLVLPAPVSAQRFRVPAASNTELPDNKMLETLSPDDDDCR